MDGVASHPLWIVIWQCRMFTWPAQHLQLHNFQLATFNLRGANISWAHVLTPYHGWLCFTLGQHSVNPSTLNSGIVLLMIIAMYERSNLKPGQPPPLIYFWINAWTTRYNGLDKVCIMWFALYMLLSHWSHTSKGFAIPYNQIFLLGIFFRIIRGWSGIREYCLIILL